MSHKFISNTACEYFPCHDGIPEAQFNCIFCYCPLYTYPGCTGQKRYLKSGLKDCSACRLPHFGERGWDSIIKQLPIKG